MREFVTTAVIGGRQDPRVAALLENAVLFGDVPGLVGARDRQARYLTKRRADHGLLAGAKDAPLRVTFPQGQSDCLFPHLWA